MIGRTLTAAAALAVAAAASQPVQAAQERAVEPGSFFANSLEAVPWNDSEIYAFGQEVGCERECVRLYRTRDRGKTWAQMDPDVLPPSAVTASVIDGKPALLSEDGRSLYRSSDFARSFQQDDLPDGTYTLSTGNSTWVVVTRDGDDLLVRLDDDRRSEVAGTDLEFARVFLAPTFGTPEAAEKGAIAIGISGKERRPRIAMCSGALVCEKPRSLPLERAAIEAVFSPNYQDDSAIVINAINSVLLSTDGGQSFDDLGAPESPAGTVQTSISGVAVSPDFDAAKGTGAIAAAVNFSVPNPAAKAMAVQGALYVREDGGEWRITGRSAAVDEAALAVEFSRSSSTLYGSFLNLSRNQGAVVCLAPDSSGEWRSCGDDSEPGTTASSAVPGGMAESLPSSSSIPAAGSSTSLGLGQDEAAKELGDDDTGDRVARQGAGLALGLVALVGGVALAWYLRYRRR